MLRYIAENSSIDLTALFLSDFSVRNYTDAGFNTSVQWDVPLLEGYKHFFLPAVGPNQRISAVRPFVYGLTRHLRAGRFDALWMHGYAHAANLRAFWIAKRLGIKVLVRAESQMGAASGSARARRIKEPLIRRLFASVDGFLAIGSLNADYYRHYGAPEQKIFRVPYAVDNAFFQAQKAVAQPQREALRASLGLVPGRPIILYASKFIPRKRAGDLLEAYTHLSPDGRQEPTPYLLFIGDGEQRPQVEARAKEFGWPSIKFLGFKNQTELPQYFDLCDVFVLPSETEPWGLIINEVMNAAKPVIVTDEVGCARDLVRDGENGYVVTAGDTAMLADRLRLITTDLNWARSMGEKSLEIINHWGFREDLDGLQRCLEAVVGKPNGHGSS